MNRTTLLIVAVALLAAVAGAFVGGAVFGPQGAASQIGSAHPAPMLSIGDQRPDALLTDPAGAERPLSEFDGKPLVVNFWATWCPPCVRELPLLDRWHARRDDDGLAVVAIALESDLELVRTFVEQRDLTLPVRLSAPGKTDLSSRFGNVRGVLPYSVLIGADGRVLAQKMGELDADKLQQWRERATSAATSRD
jgi:thiol-disulfide isomerase/thioredoxin